MAISKDTLLTAKNQLATQSTNSTDLKSGLKRLWQGWLKFGYWLGDIMSWVWMSIFYYVLAMPIALIIKFFVDPLKIRIRKRPTYWMPKKLPPLDMRWARSQGSVPPEGRP